MSEEEKQTKSENKEEVKTETEATPTEDGGDKENSQKIFTSY